MASTYPGFVSDTNKTPIIQIVTWGLLGCAVLSTLCRAYTKYAVIRFTGLDDYFVPASLLFLVGQSVAVIVATYHGLGKPLGELSDGQIQMILKMEYLAMLFYLPSLCFSKLPTLYLLNLISPLKILRSIFYASAILIICWAISAEFVTAFQCQLPDPWRTVGRMCIDQETFYIYVESMNAFTDVILMLLPLAIALQVRTSLKRKVSVLVVFAARSFETAVILTKLILYYNVYVDVTPRIGYWPVILCNQLIQFLSLMSACILYLRPFLEALSSGFINGDDLRRRGQIVPWTLMSVDISVIPAGKSNSRPTFNGEGSPERGRPRGRSPPGENAVEKDADSSSGKDVEKLAASSANNPNWPLPEQRLSRYLKLEDSEKSDEPSRSSPAEASPEDLRIESAASTTPATEITHKDAGVESQTGQSSPVLLMGNETRRFCLEQTQKGNYPIPSSKASVQTNRQDGAPGDAAHSSPQIYAGNAASIRPSGDQLPHQTEQQEHQVEPAPPVPISGSSGWLRSLIGGKRGSRPKSHDSKSIPKQHLGTAAAVVGADSSDNDAAAPAPLRSSAPEDTTMNGTASPTHAAEGATSPPARETLPSSLMSLGSNNLPRVSQIYTPLAENEELASYISPEEAALESYRAAQRTDAEPLARHDDPDEMRT